MSKNHTYVLSIMITFHFMKKGLITVLLGIILISRSFAQINTPSGAAVPFGSKIAASSNPYGYGIVPTNLPTGAYTPASNLYGKSQDAYSAYNTWKSTYVQACGSQYRVLFDDGYSTVSEGIGYGMLLSAYAADKALFDGLWAYYKANSNSNGLMNWKMGGCTGASGTNGATDADLDAAMALIIASKQWPSATSPYTYSNEATTLITAIKTYEIQTTSFQAINGDGWGMSNTCRNPSYQSPAYYRQFATQVPGQATTWNSAITAAYALINANRNTTTGLVSNWSDQNGSANSCNGSNEYGYDACRNPWRMAVEVLWTGNSTAQTNFCTPIASYINGKGAGGAGGPVPQSGGSGTVNATFVSTFAAGICGATSTYQTIMNSMYSKTVSTVDASGYFGNTLRVISLFVQTGNFWNPSTLTACTLPSAAGAITGSTTVCAGTTGLTYSISTVSNATGYTWTVPSGATITAGSGTNSITVTMGTATGSVTVTPTNTCGNGTAATASITVNPTVTPTVTASSSATTICAGTSITLTASPTNQGAAPTYQWKKGGTAIAGATNSTFTTTTAANNDSYTVTLTSNATCASTTTVTSSAVVITVNPAVTPTVTASSSATTICAGTSITLTAAPTNQGTTPTYQWKKGGTAIAGATSSTYTTTSAANNDSYTVTMTSNATCPSPASVTSNAVVITVNPTITPTVTASSSATTICAGTSITLTAAPTNQGTAPTYQWKKGGTAIASATSSTFTTTTAANNDSYTVTMTSNATCPSPASVTSSAVVITVNPTVTPTVTASSSATTICAGTSITLTAAPTNQGTTPTYQWKKGGTAIAGATKNTYTTTTAANNDSYTVTMTSNAACPSPASVTSTAVVITVNPTVTPTVTASSSATTICAGTSITLTAAPTNQGTAPTYQWKKGGTAIASATNSTYTTTTAANNDNYTVTMTSNATCPSPASVTSTAVVITVNPTVTPTVTASSSATTICAGTSITLTAAPTNQGTTPTYQWKKGGTAIASATNSTYTTTTAANNDSYTVTLTSNAACPSPASATSTAVVITVNPTVTPTVTASSSATTICAGTSITLTASPTNQGTAPTYQWKKGGTAIAGATSSTYTTTTAANNDSYTVTLTSNASCASTTTATSSAVVITISTSVTASVSISASPGNVIYQGQSVTFTANPANGGTSPIYQWKNGGTNISGATGATYTSTTLANNDAISVSMTSNAGCVSTPTVASNSISMTVNPEPVFDASVSGPTSVTSNQSSVNYSVTSQPGMTYVWSVPPGATIVSGQGTNSIVVDFGSSSGNITLVETNPLGQTATITVPISVGSTTTPVLLPSAEVRVIVYPVPCLDNITIDLNQSASSDLSCTIIDATGNIIYLKTLHYTGSPIEIETPFAQGMYQLILQWDAHTSIQKITKIK